VAMNRRFGHELVKVHLDFTTHADTLPTDKCSGSVDGGYQPLVNRFLTSPTKASCCTLTVGPIRRALSKIHAHATTSSNCDGAAPVLRLRRGHAENTASPLYGLDDQATGVRLPAEARWFPQKGPDRLWGRG
jgi:hypothetical protein